VSVSSIQSATVTTTMEHLLFCAGRSKLELSVEADLQIYSFISRVSRNFFSPAEFSSVPGFEEVQPPKHVPMKLPLDERRWDSFDQQHRITNPAAHHTHISTMTAGGSKNSVVLRPKAVATMLLHAAKHTNTSVHGILLGSIEKNVVTVQDAVPISHGAPTQPLVEMATGLLNADSSIVGWYTAPELLQDKRAGPVALRMVAALGGAVADENKPEPALIVLQNSVLAACLQGKEQADTAFEAFGKDFGQQWLEPLKMTVENTPGASKATQEGFKSGTVVNDLMDHLDGPSSNTWFPNKEVTALVDAF
jgi:hypothetical protein